MAHKDDRITIRFDPALGGKVRSLAKRRGLPVAEYCRLMCCLEIMHDDGHHPLFKESLSEGEAGRQIDPPPQVGAIRRSLEAVTTIKTAADQLMTWLSAVDHASEAFCCRPGPDTPPPAPSCKSRRTRPEGLPMVPLTRRRANSGST